MIKPEGEPFVCAQLEVWPDGDDDDGDDDDDDDDESKMRRERANVYRASEAEGEGEKLLRGSPIEMSRFASADEEGDGLTCPPPGRTRTSTLAADDDNPPLNLGGEGEATAVVSRGLPRFKDDRAKGMGGCS